jgi:hypothetical protein
VFLYCYRHFSFDVPLIGFYWFELTPCRQDVLLKETNSLNITKNRQPNLLLRSNRSSSFVPRSVGKGGLKSVKHSQLNPSIADG